MHPSSLYFAAALYFTTSLALPQLYYSQEVALYADEATFEADVALAPGRLVGDDLFVDANGNALSTIEDSSWQTTVINAHNSARAHYGAGRVVWNNALYPGALQWAKQCKFVHSGGHYGENLAAGTGGGYGFLNGFQDWMGESRGYDYNKDFQPGKGHFTQVVWKASNQVACAIADCPAGTIFSQPSKYIVCRYLPQGNVIGQFRKNVGRPV